jgi:carbon storage regulator
MLVLKRKLRESIQIGDNIKITLTDVDGRGYARIGIEAPKDVRIMRTELLTRSAFNKNGVSKRA